MVESTQMELKYHEWLSAIAGTCYPMPGSYGKWPRLTQLLWNIYIYVGYFVMAIELGSLLTRIGTSLHEIGVICACNVATGYILQLLFKIVIFYNNNTMFRHIFDEIRNNSKEMCRNPLQDTEFPLLHDSHYKKVKIFGTAKAILEVIGNIGLIGIFVVRSLVYGVPESRITPALSWTPYDNGENPIYSLTCLYELLVFGSVTFKNGVIDLLFWAMLTIPTAQLQYMRHLMKLILKETKAIEAHHDQALTDDKRDVEIQEEMYLHLMWWVQRHQRILSMIHKLEGLVSPFVAVNYMTSLMNLFMAGLVAISTSEWTIFQQIIINAIIISNAMQLYIVSRAGDLLRSAASSTANEGWTISLFNKDPSLRQTYLFVLTRTRKPVSLRFGGVHLLSSKVFSQLIRSTLTYFVTIVQIRNKGN